MTVWRIKLNSKRDPALGRPDWDEAKDYCREAGLVGVGWGVPELSDGADLPEVLAAVRKMDGGKGGVDTIKRLAEQVQIGDLMWTRNTKGWFYLCRITGPYCYDASAGSVKYDLYSTRPATWLKTGFRDHQVPGAVITSFIGTAQTLRRLGDHPAAIRITELLWTQATDPSAETPKFTPEEAIHDLFDPIDIEDLVLLYLQAQGWLLIPSTRIKSAPVYEAAFKHLDTGETAVVSVKAGRSNVLDIPGLKSAAAGGQAFAYATHDQAYTAPPEKHGVTKITTAELVQFIRTRPELLPWRIAHWL